MPSAGKVTTATRQATVALALRRRIAELRASAKVMPASSMQHDMLLMAQTLTHLLSCWEAPDATQAEVLEYGEQRK